MSLRYLWNMNDMIFLCCVSLFSWMDYILCYKMTISHNLVTNFLHWFGNLLRVVGIWPCYYNKKAVLSQRWPRNARIAPYTSIHGCPENFREALTTPTATIPNIFHGLLFGSTLWMFLQNLKSVALSIPEIIGDTQKIGHSLDTPTLPFLKNFNRLLLGLAL